MNALRRLSRFPARMLLSRVSYRPAAPVLMALPFAALAPARALVHVQRPFSSSVESKVIGAVKFFAVCRAAPSHIPLAFPFQFLRRRRSSTAR